jgi:hypothetical protein
MGWSMHEYHVGITELHYTSENEHLTISHQLFVDDMELALEKHLDGPAHLGTEDEHPEAEKHLQQYLNNHFGVWVNGKLLKPVFIGKELEDHHHLWCHFEVNGVKDVDSLLLRNTTFFELFDDQQNMHHLTLNGNKQSVVFNRAYREKTIYIKQ